MTKNNVVPQEPSESTHLFKTPEFTKEMKKTHTILSPDIFPLHMELIKQIFIMYGYKLEVLRCEGKKVIDTGLKYLHNDMCYPAICLSGQQLYALTEGGYDLDKVALIQFQTGGGCRASNYIWLLRKALHNMGLGHIPVISLSFHSIEKHSGFKASPSLIFKGLISIVYGDMLMLLRNQIKPYEKNKGETQALVDKWIAFLVDQIKHNKGLIGRSLKKNLRDMAEDFSKIERLNIKKTKVGIVGEIYVKYSQFGNNGLEAFLESQDCEFMVPGVLGFFQFMFDNRITDYDLYGGSKMKQNISEMEDREFKIKIGTIASGDIFCTELRMKEKIRSKFGADAIEMEGAAIAQVCQLDNIPFIVIRSISDKPNGNNNITFDQFLEIASKRCAKIIKEFLN